MPVELIDRLELAIRRDPGRRGLLANEADQESWLRGELGHAARDLVQHGTEIAIVTGFAIPMPEGPVAETDGPPGSVLLADVLISLSLRVLLVTDEICGDAVQSAADSAGLRGVPVERCPVDPDAADDWIAAFQERSADLSHLMFIERPGPSHCDSTIPEEHRGRCHNMRGEVIDSITAPLHRLLAVGRRSARGLRSIGIGDGGNEIGMGRIPREELAKRLSGSQPTWIPCSIPTTWTILSGVSNWGAMALAAAVASLLNRSDLVLTWTELRQRALLADLVQQGLAVDGMARVCRPTVDGLSDHEYFDVWREIERLSRQGQTTSKPSPARDDVRRES